MNFPFKVIRGGQAEVKPAPTEFAKFDRKQVILDRLRIEILAERDRAIDRKRAKQNRR